MLRTADQFARLAVVSPAGWSLVVDLAVDWRAHEPVASDVGPLLSAEDAVANKLSGLYSRAEARDFLDVDAIRRSGRFTDDGLLMLAADRDRGFDVPMFVQQLDRARRLAPAQVTPYDVDAQELADVRARIAAWADELRDRVTPTS